MHQLPRATAVVGALLLTASGAAALAAAGPTTSDAGTTRASAPARHVQPTSVAAPLSSAVLLRHAVQPVLGADDGGGLLLAARAGGRRDTGSVLATFRGPGGHWSRVTVLGRGSDGSAPVTAAGGLGRALVGWSSSGVTPVTATVRLRDPHGHWGRPRVVVRSRDVAVLDGAEMNRHGGVALLAVKGYSGHRIVSRPAGGSWTSTPIPGCDLGDLALDDRGVVHVACLTDVDRGEESTARVWTLAPGGRLRLEHRLGRAATLGLSVARDGRETVTVGVGTSDYPPDDDEFVPARAFRVLREASPGGALSTVWSRPRTVQAQVAVTGDRLQVTFEEWAGTLPRTCCLDGPARTLLRTQAVLPAAGPVTTLDQQQFSASSEATARYDVDVTVPATGPGAILWRVAPNDDGNRVGSTRLTPLTGDGSPAPAVELPGAARDDLDRLIGDRGQLMVTSTGRVRLAWLHDVVLRRDPQSGDRLTQDGTVEVARLP